MIRSLLNEIRAHSLPTAGHYFRITEVVIARDIELTRGQVRRLPGIGLNDRLAADVYSHRPRHRKVVGPP